MRLIEETLEMKSMLLPELDNYVKKINQCISV